MTNPEKGKLILELSAGKDDLMVKKTMDLVDILINEVRVDNDTAQKDDFLRNQGEIRGFNRLKEMILRGLPSSR
jgi:hypothetical protein